MIDIVHFKRVNGQLGHGAGDAARRPDPARDGAGCGLAFRCDGERFTVLLPEADLIAALALAERLCSLVAAAPLARHGKMPGPISTSIGVAVSPANGPSATLMRRADAAVLEARSGGQAGTVIAAQLAA